MSNYDVFGMCNAIVDVISQTDDAFLETHGINKNAMNLIEEDRADMLTKASVEALETSGGSGANTVAGVASFGGALPAARLALDAFDPWFLTFVRTGGSGLCALALLIAFPQPFPRDVTSRLILSALATLFAFPLFTSMALVSVEAGHGGVVLGILPLCTAVAGVIIGRERPSRLFWLLALLGASLVIIFAFRKSNFVPAIGDVWLAVAAGCTAFGYAIQGVATRSMSGWVVISWSLVLTLPLSALGLIWSWPVDIHAADSTAWFGAFYTTVMAGFIAFFFWNAGLARGGVTRIGQVQLAQPFFTLAIAALFLGEAVTLDMWGFALAVGLVILLAQRTHISSN